MIRALPSEEIYRHPELIIPFAITDFAKDRRREFVLRQMELRHRNYARMVANIIRAEFEAVMSRLNGKVSKAELPGGIVPDPGELSRKIASRTTPVLLSIMDEFGRASMKEVGRQVLSFDLRSEDAKRWLAEKPIYFADQVATETVDRLREQLTQGFEAGESYQALQTRVINVFESSVRADAGRALRIARTEVHAAAAFGLQEGYKQAGIPRKEWHSFEGARPAHREAQGQVVSIEEPFIVGGEELFYPGDPNGSPGNIINCRCIINPVLRR